MARSAVPAARWEIDGIGLGIVAMSLTDKAVIVVALVLGKTVLLLEKVKAGVAETLLLGW